MKTSKNIFNKIFTMNFIERITGTLTGFIRVPMLITYLGTEKYGLVVLMLTLANWLLFSDFGFGNSLKNIIAKNKNNDEEIINNIRHSFSFLSFFCLIAFSLVFMFVKTNLLIELWGKYDLTPKEINLSILMMSIIYIPLLPLSLGRNIYYIYGKGNIYSFFISISSILNLLLIFLAIKFSLPIYYIILFSNMISNIAQSILLICFIKIKFNTMNLICNPFKHKNYELINIGMKFFILQIVSLIINQTDNIIVERFAGLSSVSVYSVCIQLYNVGVIVVGTLSETYWTDYANKYHSRDFKSLKNSFNSHKKISYVYSILAVSGYMILAKPFIKIWTNGRIIPPTELILVISVLFLLKILNGPLVTFLNALNVLNEQLLPSIINAILNLVLSVIFVKYIGITGAALGTVIPFLIFSLIYDFYLCRNVLYNKLSVK